MEATYQAPINNFAGQSFIGNQFHGQVNLQSSDAAQAFLHELRATDPRLDKSRILRNKDKIVQDSCNWVWDDEDFRAWWRGNDSSILHLHGEAGKGKTMIAISLTEDIQKKFEQENIGSSLIYFFCQSTIPLLNNATSILQGLIFFLATENRVTLSCIRELCDREGTSLLHGHNSLYASWNLLREMLNKVESAKLCIMIDALDECNENVEELMTFLINYERPNSLSLKLLFTSRNEPQITRMLQGHNRLHTSLDVNKQHVSRAITKFIDCKVQELSVKMDWDSALKSDVTEYLTSNANGTFLWVALVCKELEGKIKPFVRDVMRGFPSGLAALYSTMLKNIELRKHEAMVKDIKTVLRLTSTSLRPRKIEEIIPASEISAERYYDDTYVEALVLECGPILIIQEDKTISFVHQSAKDFFETGEGARIFESGLNQEHNIVAMRSLQVMRHHLKNDICNLKSPDAAPDRDRVEFVLPAHVRYACEFWTDHVQIAGQLAQSPSLDASERILDFLSTYFLYWIESLSLLGVVYKAISGVENLQSVFANEQDLYEFLCDAARFLRRFKPIIEIAPLQLYISALIFSPTKSIVRRKFISVLPARFKTLSPAQEYWDSSLYTIEWPPYAFTLLSTAHVSSEDVLFGTYPDLGSGGALMCAWDVKTSRLKYELRWQGPVSFEGISADGRFLAVSADGLTTIWNTSIGKVSAELETGRAPKKCDTSVRRICISEDVTMIVVENEHEHEAGFSVWDIATACPISSIPISNEYFIVALWLVSEHNLVAIEMQSSGKRKSHHKMGKIGRSRIEVRDCRTGNLRQSFSSFRARENYHHSFAFSGNGLSFAYQTGPIECQIWQLDSSGNFNFMHSLKTSSSFNAMTFSHSGRFLATSDGTLFTLNVSNPSSGKTHLSNRINRTVRPFEFSKDETMYSVILSDEDKVEIRNTENAALVNSIECRIGLVGWQKFSKDGTMLICNYGSSIEAYALLPQPGLPQSPRRRTEKFDRQSVQLIPSSGKALVKCFSGIEIWDATTGVFEREIKTPGSPQFFADEKLLAFESIRGRIKLIDHRSYRKIAEFALPSYSEDAGISAIALSAEREIAIAIESPALKNTIIEVWDYFSCEKKYSLYEVERLWIGCLCFSNNGKKLAAGCRNGYAYTWNTTTKGLEHTILRYRPAEGLETFLSYNVVFSLDDHFLAIACSFGICLKWDLRTEEVIAVMEFEAGVFGTHGFLRIVQNPIFDGSARDEASRSFVNCEQGVYDENAPYHIDQSRDWIVYQNSRQIWLPPKCRPTTSIRGPTWDAWGNILLILNTANELIFLKFQEEEDQVCSGAWLPTATRKRKRDVDSEDCSEKELGESIQNDSELDSELDSEQDSEQDSELDSEQDSESDSEQNSE